MRTRIDFHNLLLTIEGPKKVYYQPPEGHRMVFPCIQYSLSNNQARHANDGLYLNKKSYEVMVIDPNPDSEIPDAIQNLPLTRFNRKYISENNYYSVFTVYY